MPTFLPPALLGFAIIVVVLSPLSGLRTRSRVRAYTDTSQATRYAILVTLYPDCTLVALVLIIVANVPGMNPLPSAWHGLLVYVAVCLGIAGILFLAYAMNLRQRIRADRR
jgi:hypothetical protein